MADATTTEMPAAPPARGDRFIASGWYGVWWLVATEGALFGYLLFAYIYSYMKTGYGWPTDGLPSLRLALPNTILLLASSGVMVLAEKMGRRGRDGWEAALLVLTILMGIVFVVVQGFEWHDKSFSYDTNLYGSFYFTVTGFHMAHVIAGILGLSTLAVWLIVGRKDELGPTLKLHQRPVTIGSVYWHFVDVVWLFVFTTFYLAPYWR